jgi:hypothetical protein
MEWKQQQYRDPDIGTAWLLLSHGAFLTAAVAALGISTALYTSKWTYESRLLCCGGAIGSFTILAWILYAIYRTWQAAKQFQDKIFTDIAFEILLMVTAVWMLYAAIIFVFAVKKQIK